LTNIVLYVIINLYNLWKEGEHPHYSLNYSKIAYHAPNGVVYDASALSVAALPF
jgi:hypothetical protein